MTPDSERAAIDRRTILASGGALLTQGCVHCAFPPPLGPRESNDMEIGDAHAHLFNAADLPVVGFLENVLLPAYLSAWEPLWPALLSISGVLKTLALPADRERKDLGQSRFLAGSDEVSPGHFANVIAEDIEAHAGASIREAPLSGRATALSDSYKLLARLLAEANPSTAAEGGANAGPASSASAMPVDRGFIARLALSGADAVTAPVDPTRLWPGFVPDARALVQLPSIWDGIKWVYALVQPRCSHVRKYLDSMDSSETRTTRVINLLVDYDLWVGDGAAAGSGTLEQLKFWTDFREKAGDRVAVETFAPYDPLRHAEDRLRNGNDDGYFAEVKSWADGTASGVRIAGYKLYPPMGFRAKGNAGEPPATRAGAIIRKRWNQVGWPVSSFGTELEASLDPFFEYCAAKGIPILAHARNSNEASPDAGDNANPRYWLERSQSAPGPLKICLAHFSPDDPPRQWGIDIYREVLEANAAGKAQIFFDLAFADELLTGNAKLLMEKIGVLCTQSDPECDWFVFGTDWIMLAQLHKVERYIPELLRAARTIPFWSQKASRLDNLLRNNLGRFLSGT